MHKIYFYPFWWIFEKFVPGSWFTAIFMAKDQVFENLFFFSFRASERKKSWKRQSICNRYLSLFIVRHYNCKKRFFRRKNDVIKYDVIYKWGLGPIYVYWAIFLLIQGWFVNRTSFSVKTAFKQTFGRKSATFLKLKIVLLQRNIQKYCF